MSWQPRRRQPARAVLTVLPTGPLTALLIGLLAAAPVLTVPGSSAAAAPVPTTRGTAEPAPADTATRTLKSRARPEIDAPLRVRIDTLSPSYLPEQGTIEVTGTVTNRSDEPWTTVNLYAFLGDDRAPMTDRGELAAAAQLPFDAVLGSRTTAAKADVGTLEPDETASYRLEVPVSAFDIDEVSAGGVYWFGVHALGTTSDGSRDEQADGRARTFLPHVPDQVRTPVSTSLVVPLTRALAYRDDGSLRHPERWARRLQSGGRLRDLLSLGQAADDSLTWLVDPALVDAVGRLRAGNPPRSLAPTPPPTGDPSASQSPGSSPSPDAATSPGAQPSTVATDTPSARAAAAWLDTLGEVLPDDEVLVQPYGNIDVPGALAHDPGLYELARAQSSAVLDEMGIDRTPALAAPEGMLNADAIRIAEPDTRLLVEDTLLAGTEGPAPAVARFDGHSMLVTSSGAAAGGPGPGPRLSTVSLRQRILAEAAVRALRPSRPPLVVMLPEKRSLDDPEGFFEGLDVDWLDLKPASEIQRSNPSRLVDAEDIAYPEAARRRELDRLPFLAASRLIEAGDTLQGVLAENNRVAGEVTEQALSGVSYDRRARPRATRASLDRSHDWIDARLQQIQIVAAEGVTLSSESGTFVVTLRNRLAEPVLVRVAADSESGIRLSSPEPVELGGGSRVNIPLEATTTDNRVHSITIRVTDADGTPLGGSVRLPIRSVQVSWVIWLILGVGAGVLVLAIATRLVRRVRRAREPVAQPTDQPATTT